MLSRNFSSTIRGYLRAIPRWLFRVVERGARSRHLPVSAYLHMTVRSTLQPLYDLKVQRFSRILVLRLDDIGDFVLTSPLLRAMRNGFPSAHISLLINSRVADLARECPYVNEIIEVDVARAPAPIDQLVTLVRAKEFAKRELADKGFQCALIPRPDIDNAGALAMAYYAGIPVRIGYSEWVLPLKHTKNRGYDRFLTHPIGSLQGSHEVEWLLNIGEIVGADVRDDRLELWPPHASRQAVRAVLSTARHKDKPLIALAPGASLDRRRWPVASFAALANMLIERRAARIIVVGAAGDAESGERIKSGAGAGDVINAAGRLSLNETASLLGECQLFIGNDSGPMHMAAAMGVPCVEISCHPKDGGRLAANSPTRFAPWGVRNVVMQPQHASTPCSGSCSKNYAHCIMQVTIDEVFMAAEELLCYSVDQMAKKLP